jgi:prephenate dehydrogenase
VKTVAIVGVGLIGGSFALALRKAGFSGKIIGVSSPRTIAEALRLKAVDEGLPLEEAAPQSDLIYLAQPIIRILELFDQLDPHLKPGALVTDAGSTKMEINERASVIRRGLFLGGHPMAGKESRGVAAAEADLFVGRPYILTPSRPADLEEPSVVEFLDWVRRIGSRPIVLDPAAHDELVALASHLPQLASTALAAALSGQPAASKIGQVAGPGLIDSTRLALSPFDVWDDILNTNTAEIDKALATYIETLQQIRRELTAGSLEERFEAAEDFSKDLRRKQR